MFRIVQRLFSTRISAYHVRSFCTQWTRQRLARSYRPALSPALALAFSIPFLRGKSPEEEVREAWALGLHFIHVGELSKAEERLQSVLRLLSEQFERGEITQRELQSKRGRVSCEMANLALLSGRLARAEALLRATMKDCVDCGISPRGREMVEMSLKLAAIMAQGHRSAEAETGFRFCVDVMQELVAKAEGDEDEVKNDRALLGMAASAYGKFLLKENRHQDSLKMVRLALAEARRVFDEATAVVVSLMNDEAVVLTEMGQRKEAEAVFRAAIEIAEFRPDLLLEELPPLYINLAALMVSSKRLKDAEEMGQTALRLLKDMPPTPGNEATRKQADAMLGKISSIKEANLKKNSV